MSAAAKSNISTLRGQAARRELILDAAEKCFVRNGLHRTTIQDLSTETEMSQGNIYRYFKSKEDIVLGLALRQREQATARIKNRASNISAVDCLFDVLITYFVDADRNRAVLALDLWSEFNRTPAVRQMLAESEAGLRTYFITVVLEAGYSGGDVESFYQTASVLMKGALVSRAVQADYNPQPVISQLRALFDTALHTKSGACN